MLPLEHLNKRGCSPTKLTLERKMKIFVTAMFDHGDLVNWGMEWNGME